MKTWKKFKNWFTGELNKLKDMSGKERWWYIWTYYRLQIIFGSLALCCLISVAANLLDPHKVYLNTVTVNVSTITLEPPAQLTEEFHTAMGLGKYDEVDSEGFVINFAEQYTQDDYQAVQRLFTLIGAREVDTLLMGQTELELLAEHVAFADLQKVLPPDLWQQLQPRILYVVPEEGAAPFPAGIDISDTPFVKSCDFLANSVVLALTPNSRHPEHGIAFLRYILTYQ